MSPILGLDNALRSDTSEGATGRQELFGHPNSIGMGQTRRSYDFTIASAAKIDATKICHKCGYCATIVQSGQLAHLAPVENSGRGGWPARRNRQ
jgi:hypothetical protein